jgi:hypothetical protein
MAFPILAFAVDDEHQTLSGTAAAACVANGFAPAKETTYW